MSPYQYRVVIIQKRLPQYRKPFFELLKAKLAEKNIDLVFVYGTPTSAHKQRKDNVQINWAHAVSNLEIKLGRSYVLWQPCLRYIRNADIVIVEQASKLLVNYILFFLHVMGMVNLCFWGHGRSELTEKKNALGERVKEAMSTKVHWWFAYNDWSANIVAALGFPRKKITSVQNAVDTTELIEYYNALTEQECNSIKQKYSITSKNICLFIGSLYAERKIDFLLSACQLIRQKIPDFEIVILGGGPEEYKVKRTAETNTWIHFIGPVFGEAKVPFFKMSKLLLLPGPVGLVAVESFALETPLVTIDVPTHGPEIDYIIHGENGIILKETHTPKTYAKNVMEILNDPQKIDKLKVGCRSSRTKYTLEAMVENFAEGIQEALQFAR